MKSFVCRYCSCCCFEAHCPHLTFDNGKKRKHAAAVETVLISFSSYFCSVDQQKKVKRKRKESTRFVLFGYNFLCSRRQRPTLKNSKNGSRQTVKKGTTINCRAVWQVYSVFTLFSAFFCFEYSPLRSWQSSILTVVVGVVGVLVSTSRPLSFPSTFFPLPPFFSVRLIHVPIHYRKRATSRRCRRCRLNVSTSHGSWAQLCSLLCSPPSPHSPICRPSICIEIKLNSAAKYCSNNCCCCSVNRWCDDGVTG